MSVRHATIKKPLDILKAEEWNMPHIVEIGRIDRVKRIQVDSDVTEIDITGLNGDEDEIYILLGLIKNPGGDGWIGFRYNNDSGENYVRIDAWIDSDGYHYGGPYDTGIDATFAPFIYLKAGEYGFSRVWIWAKSGTYRIHFVDWINPIRISRNFHHGYWKNTTDNITSLRIVRGTGTSVIGAGSIIWLLKYRI